MSSHPIFSEELLEIVESFVIETQESFEELDNDLLALEANAHDKALVDKIFRAVHTVKGTSGFLSLEQLSYLAHHFEDVLNRLRRGELDLHASMMDVMFTAFDLMKVLLQQVVDQRLEEIDLSGVVTSLQAISDGTFVTEGAAKAEPAPAPAKVAAPEAPVEVPAAPAPEPLPNNSDENKTPKPAKAEPKDKEAPKDAKATARRKSETIRVEVQRLDTLMDLVGELVLGRNRLLQLITDLSENDKAEEHLRELLDTSTQVDFITTELQAAVMSTRMVQIGRVFNKFPRVVRDLAKEFSKEIALVIEGQETEVDKSLIEEISDPLVHLIRNASDHGIETPEVQIGRAHV